jgi:hypothetical protein
MNLVDSSGWLEYFADESNANYFAPLIEDVDNLLVPTDESLALQAVALMGVGLLILQI